MMNLTHNRLTWAIRKALWPHGFDICSYPNMKAMLTSCDIVVDAGAAMGDTYDWVRRMGFAGTVISFEPVSTSWWAMMRREKPDRLWFRRNECLSDVEGETSFWRNDAQLEWSGLAPTPGAVATAVETVRLDTLLSPGDQRSIFLKTDCEGHDLRVVKGAGAALERVKYVLMEVATTPRYMGEPGFAEVVAEMDRLGFTVACNLGNLFTDGNRRAAAMDVVFERKAGS